MVASSALREPLAERPEHGALEWIRSASREARALCQEVLTEREGNAAASDRMRQLDFGQWLEGVQPLLVGAIPESATFNGEYDADGIRIEGDRRRLNRVVLNLIKNAAESLAGKTGSITVRGGSSEVGTTRRETPTRKRVRPGRYAYIEVVDTGCGMPESFVAKLFEPRDSTKPSGRGLGLRSVQAIVAEHRGFIEVHSEVGNGTTVRVSLPILNVAPPQRGAPSS